MSRKFRTKEWAIMMFIANDNDLGKFTDAKIEEINSVGSTLASDVIIQYDTPGPSKIRRMRLSKGRKFPLRALQDETNTGDKRTLIRFVDLTLEDFHARRAMLAIDNHGSGSAIAGDQLIERDSASRSNPHGGCTRCHTRLPIFSTPSSPTQAVAPLAANSITPSVDALDLLELKSAMASIVRRHQRLELLAFDACLMGTFEVAYQLRDAARVMVASQSNIPVPGCRFASTFAFMRDETRSTADAAKQLVNDVTPVVADEYSAMAALDLDQADELAEAISILAESLLAAMRDDANLFRKIRTAHLSSLAFLDSDTIDLFSLCEQLREMLEDNEIVCDAAADVQDAIEHQFVLHANPCGAIVRGARGISITLPRKNSLSDTYRQLDFARNTPWVEFLDTYLQQAFPPIVEGVL